MSTGTRGVVIVLACMACASAVSAQSPQEGQPRVLTLRGQAQQERQQQRPQTLQRRGPVRQGSGEAAAETSEPFTYTARLSRGGTFELRNMTGGNVTVNGGEGREVRIEGMKLVRNAGPRAQAALDAIRIDVAERGGNVAVLTMSRAGGARTAQTNRTIAIVDYTITLPPNANVVLRSGTGDLRLHNVSGDVFELNTLSGNVVMQELRGRMLDLYSVTGNMSLQNIAAERALLQSMGGNIEYVGPLVHAGLYKFITHRGNIRFAPSGAPGFDLDAKTYRGALRSEFQLLQVPPRSPRPVQRALKGKVGDAGAAVTASTFSGNIVIIKP
jgi:hypothetical protein